MPTPEFLQEAFFAEPMSTVLPFTNESCRLAPDHAQQSDFDYHRYQEPPLSLTQRVATTCESGLHARAEPDTYNLLLGDFSQSNCKRACTSCFKALQDRVNAVVNAVELIRSPSCVMSDAEKKEYVQKRVDAEKEDAD